MRILLLSWLFFLPMCSILLGVEIGAVSGQCLSDQKDLLLQLKNSLIFNATQSKKLVQWNQNLDCCSWDGVTCDGGRVTGLNLSNEWISGGVDNSSLFNLQHLKSLDLSYNNINLTFPPGIGNLRNLTYLNLSNAGFGGQIPEDISRLTKLVTLDISTLPLLQISSLKLENPNLSMLLQNLSELEELYLDGVNISSRGSEWCQALSSSVPNLRVLSLSNCFLSGPLDQSLKKLHSLSVIRLDNNNLSSLVPGFIANLTNLTSLSLRSCQLHGTFPKVIFQVPTLQHIDLSDNQLLQGSLPEFHKNNALQAMALSSTRFSGSLPSSIGNLSSLNRLDLSSCHFNGTLPISMGKLTQLVYLDLSFNEFNGSIPSFKMSKNLTKIVLSHNSLTRSITSAHWEGLNKLVVVDLRNNLLNGSIPSSLFELPSLKEVSLDNNQFDGTLPEFFNVPTSLLETLDLSSNNLEGPIPMSIFDLRKLSILTLSSNKLNGSIQLEKFQVFHNLTSLDLSYNNLFVIASGNDSTWSSFSKISTLKLASCHLKVIPYLKNQSKITHLDLSKNQIQGEVPYWIWEVGNGSLLHLNLSCNQLESLENIRFLPNTLSVLDLHSNNISGTIPVLPPSVTYVDLSSNNFTSIPADIGKSLLFTIFFSLSNNGLKGEIPESVCSASSIKVLDLSDNSLSGGIPGCMPTMSLILRVLNLRRNKLTGQIPDKFPVNCRLRTLDVNSNSIEGKIPQSLANCTELEVLNLGNNKMSDRFPCMLKNISALRVVILRSNQFQGHIGCPNTTGIWDMLQILDLARNKFDGTIPGKCLTTWRAMKDDEDEIESKTNHIQFEILKYSQKYYQDAITVTSKGLEMEFVNILTVFNSIDFSCNNFVGPMPEEVGQLEGLYALNLSHNGLIGQIPSSVGKLLQLESLDLSNNNLTGTIPTSLAVLSFLSFLDLSFNRLVGQIPTGTQIQTFSAASFQGNIGLCGPPLPKNCSSPSYSADAESGILSGIEFNWQSIYSGIGFGVGSGAVVALLTFWQQGKNWLDDGIDKILLVILPMLGYAYKPRDQWDDEDETEDEDEDFAEDHEEDDPEDKELQGQYCVFCSKFDVTMTRVIHDPRCTCHSTPRSSSSSFTSTTSSYSP